MAQESDITCKTILAGTIAKGLLAEVKDGLDKLNSKPPHLLGVLANDDPSAKVYADWTAKSCRDKYDKRLDSLG